MSTALAVQQSAPLFTVSTLLEANEFALQMSKANLLPAHLKGSPADCLRVVMQAARWNFDPFSVADKTSVIGGKLMYEGQLVAAVINSRGNLTKKLKYDFKGEGTSRSLTVTGTLPGEDEPRTIDLPFAQAAKINKNGQMGINPDQQMCYIGSRIWARRHMPELMLGVYTPDEITPDDDSPVNVTPQVTTPDSDPAPVRAEPPPRRTRKGANAVDATPATEVQATEVVTPASTPAPIADAYQAAKADATPANAGIGAPLAASTPVKEATAEPAKATPAPESRAFLKDAEEYVTTATVVEVAGMVATYKGVPNTPTSKVSLKGGYVGMVYHFGGGTITGTTPAAGDQPEKPIVTPLPVWAVGAVVKVKLMGKLNANNGKVLVRVEEVSAAGGAATAGEEVDVG